MGKRKLVFILSLGERGEGSGILGAFGEMESARVAALEYWHDYPLPKDPLPTWVIESSTSEVAALNSVDYLMIETFEVRP